MTAIGSPSSPRFPSLPPEIRNQTWHQVLSGKPPPAFFNYKKGCWQSRFISETDKDYDPVNFYGIYLAYRHDLLDRVEVEIPLFFVNRETRGIAQDWISKNGIEISFHKGASQPVFLRRFGPLTDVLRVPIDIYDHFCQEPVERLFEPDLIGQDVSCDGCAISTIAIAEESFWKCKVDFDEVMFDWFYPSTLLVVLNAQADLDTGDGDAKPRHSAFAGFWERALIWDHGHQKFHWDEGKHVCDQDMYKKVEQVANEDVVGKLVRDRIRRFKIRPILAMEE